MILENKKKYKSNNTVDPERGIHHKMAIIHHNI
jgi:hypothetical protein